MDGSQNIRLWDATAGTVLQRFGGAEERVYRGLVSDDGNFALTTDGPEWNAHLWDLNSKSIRLQFKATTGSLTIASSSDRKRVLVGDKKSASLWDIASGNEVRQYQFTDKSIPRGDILAISYDGSRALTGWFWPDARVWDLNIGKEVCRLQGRADTVCCMAISADGRLALGGYDDGIARLLDFKTGVLPRRIEGHREDHPGAGKMVNSVAMSSNGKIGLTGGQDGTVRLWDIPSGRELIRLEVPKNIVHDVALSPDNKLALTGEGFRYSGKVGYARLWDLATGTEVRSFSGHLDIVTSVAFSADGKFILTGGSDGTARLWDLSSGKEIRRLTAGDHSTPVTSVALSPDGKSALVGIGSYEAMIDGKIILWNLIDDNVLRYLEGHRGDVRSVSFSPDGKQALSGGRDGTSSLWDLASRERSSSA